MKLRFVTAVAAIALLTPLMPAPAQAQLDSVFEIKRGDDSVPDVNEYNNVPKGLLLTRDKKEVEEEEHEAEEQAAPKAALSYEAVLKFYRQGDFDKILPSLQLLTESKHAGAEELLGVMYSLGQGVEKDKTRAFELLSRAAAVDRPLAQHHLGTMNFLGEGTEKNPVQGLTWLFLAVINYTDGPEKAAAVKDKEAVMRTLSRRDKESALYLAREWLAKKGEAHLLDMQ